MDKNDTRHIILQAAGECMSPDQYGALEALAANDSEVYDRFLRCIEKRIAEKARSAIDSVFFDGLVLQELRFADTDEEMRDIIDAHIAVSTRPKEST